jgi:hypothetical protein
MIILLLLILSCNTLFQNSDTFNNKDEVINVVKMNISHLENLSKELCTVYKSSNYIVIENKQKMLNNSVEYQTDLCKRIFKELRLRDIRVYSNERKVIFTLNIKNNYDYPVIVYSFDNNKYYDLSDYDNSDDKTILEHGNWVASFDNKRYRYGWYKERVYNCFYYQERYYDGFHCIKYIKDDLKQMKEYAEIHDKFREYFDE